MSDPREPTDQGTWNLVRQMLTDDTRVAEVIDEMERTGGGFIKSLANCWRHADAFNKRRLQNLFVEYFITYGRVVLERARRAPEK